MERFFLRWAKSPVMVLVLWGALVAPLAMAADESAVSPHDTQLENNPELYLRQIRSIQQEGLFYASLAHLDDFALRWPDNDHATLLRAHALQGIGQVEKARELYKKLLGGKFSAEAYYGMGMIDLKAGRTEDAIDELNRAAALAPIDVEILNDQGAALMAAGKLEAAGQSLLRASELDRKSKPVGANLAQLQIMEGQSEQADATMRRYGFSAPMQQDIRQKAAEAVKKAAEPAKKTP